MNGDVIKIGEWYFDSIDYDAENDVLYLSMGEPRSGYGEETVEGHIARFDETGEFCGVTLIGVRQTLDKGDAVSVSLPRRVFPRRECLTGGELRRVLV